MSQSSGLTGSRWHTEPRGPSRKSPARMCTGAGRQPATAGPGLEPSFTPAATLICPLPSTHVLGLASPAPPLPPISSQVRGRSWRPPAPRGRAGLSKAEGPGRPFAVGGAITAEGDLAPSERDGLAARLGLANAQVVTWFQNRRAKLKRDVEEMRADVASLSALSPDVQGRLALPRGAPAPGRPDSGPHLAEEEIEADA